MPRPSETHDFAIFGGESLNRQEALCRIVFVLHDLQLGGAQRHSIDVALSLRRAGFWVQVVVLGGRIDDEMWTAEVAEITTFLPVRLFRRPADLVQIVRTLKLAAPDLIVAINQMPQVVSRIASIFGRLGAPNVCVFHTTILPSFAARLQQPLFRLAVRGAGSLIFVSANQKDYWTKRGLRAKRADVITNGVDLSWFSLPSPEDRIAAKRRLGFGTDDYVVGICAGFRNEKNHDQILDAVAKLKARGIRGKLLLVGDGARREAIMSRIADLELLDDVVLVGVQVDVRPFVAAMDVGVICSTAVETMSLAALESMAMGVPMVMSKIGGASEIIIDGKNGYLFDVGDTEALVDRLAALSVPATRVALAVGARSVVEDRFDSRVMHKRYSELFRCIVAGSVGRSRAYGIGGE